MREEIFELLHDKHPNKWLNSRQIAKGIGVDIDNPTERVKLNIQICKLYKMRLIGKRTAQIQFEGKNPKNTKEYIGITEYNKEELQEWVRQK